MTTLGNFQTPQSFTTPGQIQVPPKMITPGQVQIPETIIHKIKQIFNQVMITPGQLQQPESFTTPMTPHTPLQMFNTGGMSTGDFENPDEKAADIAGGMADAAKGGFNLSDKEWRRMTDGLKGIERNFLTEVKNKLRNIYGGNKEFITELESISNESPFASEDVQEIVLDYLGEDVWSEIFNQ